MFVRNLLRYLCLVSLVVLLSGCMAAPTVSTQQMFINLSRSYPELWRLITALSYVIGLALAYQALYHMKIYGELRTMMASHQSLKTPVTYLIAATMLVYFPTAFNIFEMTVFNTTGATIIGYGDTGPAGFTEAQDAVMGFIQIIGLIAFVRGWVILAKSAKQGAQPQTGKAFTHIFGGLLAINIIGTRDIIYNTFFSAH